MTRAGGIGGGLVGKAGEARAIEGRTALGDRLGHRMAAGEGTADLTAGGVKTRLSLTFAAADDALLSGVQRWNGGTNFTSWIYRRTQWTAITALRRRARAPEPTDDEIIDLRAADDVESEVLLRSVIESLDAAELVCASILFSGGSSREVADTLRVHRNTVRTIKQRLLTKLNLKGGGDQ